MRETLRQLYPVRRRKVIKKCTKGILGVLAVWCTATVIIVHNVQSTSFTDVRWLYWIGILVGLLLWRTGYQIIYYFTYYYDTDGKNIIIRKGVVAKREITLPYTKITDVYVDQDVLDVMFGLFDLHISTPTAESGRFAHIDGLNRTDAYALRGLILEWMNSDSEAAPTKKPRLHAA